MNNKTLTVVFLLVILTLPVFSQTYAFKVLVNKGKNEIKVGNAWQSMKVGASLTEKDEIKISPNAYVGLVHSSGKPIELREAKTYKIADLTKSVTVGSSVVTKYTDFILSSNSAPKSNMNATGAVHRGPKEVAVFLPKTPGTTVFYNEHQTISWDVAEKAAPYVVTFTTLFEDELKKIETADGQVKINLNSSEFQNEDNIMVVVLSKGDGRQSSKYTLKRLSKSDHQKIENQLKEIAPSTQEETALNRYIMAGFFEQNNLLIDAATQYQEAIALAPEVAEYKQYYHEFLLRTGMKDGSKK